MSSPLVAGTVALMLEADPGLTVAQIRAMLIASAVPPSGVSPFDEAWGYGMLDSDAAVAFLRGEVP